MQPTPQQQAAISTTGRALLVDAGAGTGKTRVLTERFLYMLEAHQDWPLEGIVAVTYTEKAAREMRSRIRDAIETKAKEPDARPFWHDHRLNLEKLRVSTIHSLCARILRENAIAAGIDPRFELLDEPTTLLIREEAMDNVFSALAEEDDPALQLLAALRVADLQDEMAVLLSHRSTVQRLFDALPEPDALLAHWQAQVAALYETIWQDAVAAEPELTTALATFPVEITDPTDKLAPSVKAANEGITLIEARQFLQAAQLFEPIKVQGGRQAVWDGKEALAELKAMLKALRAAGKSLLKIGEFGAADEKAAHLLQLWRQLWEWVNAEYDRLKASRQALDFDDLLLQTARLFEDHKDNPRLQAFRTGIHHLMVDEFQDTNLLQKQIIYALASPDDAGRLFVVGDAKQSIYRFQQAQVSVFNETRREIEQATGQPALPLNLSFRTQSVLVAALNNLFDHILQPARATHASYEAQPGPLEATRKAREADAIPVEILIIPKKDSEDNGIDAETARRWEAHWVADRIKKLVTDGTEIWDKNLGSYRPFRYDDAAVLFRTTSTIPLFEEIFKSAGLPYLTLSGRGYFDRPEINDLLALLNCLFNPADDLHLAAVLRSPLFGFSDETLYRLRWHPGDEIETPVPYAAALAHPPETDQPERIAFAYTTMKALWKLAGRVSVWKILRTALDLTGYEAVLALDDAITGERQLNNVQKFMAMARVQADTSLSVFLQQVQQLKIREVRESEASADAPEAGAVQLMTVHAAKGLEFPVVAVVDMGRAPRSGTTSRIIHDPQFGIVCKHRDENGDWQAPASYTWGKWQHDHMETAEHKRLFYVACTRAGDLLLLSGKDGSRDTWLTYTTDAWNIDPSGPAEETLQFADFAVNVHRPTELPDLDRRDQQHAIPPLASQPAAPTYDLAWPLEQFAYHQTIAVTQASHPSVDKVSAIQPAVRSGSRRVSAATIGDMVHHALANWHCLSQGRSQLEQWLAHDARRMGIIESSSIDDAVGRSITMLNRLIQSPLYKAITAAQKRYTELPIMLRDGNNLVHGSVDMLYQASDGTWHVIDWKTEYLDKGDPHGQILAHKQQLTLYVEAVKRQIGITPSAMLCFLNPQLTLYRLETEN